MLTHAYSPPLMYVINEDFRVAARGLRNEVLHIAYNICAILKIVLQILQVILGISDFIPKLQTTYITQSNPYNKS